MSFSRGREKQLLFALSVILALLVVYRLYNASPRKTAPLRYARGAVAGSPVRQGLTSRPMGSDPLNVYLARRQETYPGVGRDIFRMENPVPRAKPVLVSLPVVTAVTVTAPEKTPEERAADQARADLSTFRFLGYLTDKDNTLFLSKDGEIFMVRSGETVLKSYTVKEAGRDYAVLIDTVTRVEMRIELTGGEQSPPAATAPLPRVR